MDLAALWEEARNKGWATQTASLDEVTHQASRLGWEAIPTRRGEGAKSLLKPTNRQNAHPRSMSAVHGLDTQPLHVDGSHMVTPPDAIILYSTTPNKTPTRLWTLPKQARGSEVPFGSMAHGVFIVGSGRSAFLAPMLEYQRGHPLLRYDPTIMMPADLRSRNAAAFFGSVEEAVTSHTWEQPKTVLLINNRAVLHGRGAVLPEDETRELVRYSFYVGDKK